MRTTRASPLIIKIMECACLQLKQLFLAHFVFYLPTIILGCLFFNIDQLKSATQISFITFLEGKHNCNKTLRYLKAHKNLKPKIVFCIEQFRTLLAGKASFRTVNVPLQSTPSSQRWQITGSTHVIEHRSQTNQKRWRCKGLNQGPHSCEAGALQLSDFPECQALRLLNDLIMA